MLLFTPQQLDGKAPLLKAPLAYVIKHGEVELEAQPEASCLWISIHSVGRHFEHYERKIVTINSPSYKPDTTDLPEDVNLRLDRSRAWGKSRTLILLSEHSNKMTLTTGTPTDECTAQISPENLLAVDIITTGTYCVLVSASWTMCRQ